MPSSRADPVRRFRLHRAETSSEPADEGTASSVAGRSRRRRVGVSEMDGPTRGPGRGT